MAQEKPVDDLPRSTAHRIGPALNVIVAPEVNQSHIFLVQASLKAGLTGFC
jgi:hypothetical protein